MFSVFRALGFSVSLAFCHQNHCPSCSWKYSGPVSDLGEQGTEAREHSPCPQWSVQESLAVCLSFHPPGSVVVYNHFFSFNTLPWLGFSNSLQILQKMK